MVHEKKILKKQYIILVPSQTYKDFWKLLQNPKVPKIVLGFSNHAQGFTPPYYLDVDNPFWHLNHLLMLFGRPELSRGRPFCKVILWPWTIANGWYWYWYCLKSSSSPTWKRTSDEGWEGEYNLLAGCSRKGHYYDFCPSFSEGDNK